ncbi:unnamed protein product [Rhizophagus irregularis]|nr:unnamed protein product [Rhizophagus irregularis]
MYSKESDLEYNKKNPTEIIESLDIGPVPKNNPDNDDGRNIKRNKLYEDEEYLTKEIELDIVTNFNNNEYITTEIDFDI